MVFGIIFHQKVKSSSLPLKCACVLCRFRRVWLFPTPGTVAHQASLSMGFSNQEYWSGLPYPSPGDLPTQGSNPPSLMSPALADMFFTTSAPWEDPLNVDGTKWLTYSKQAVVELMMYSRSRHQFINLLDIVTLFYTASACLPTPSHPESSLAVQLRLSSGPLCSGGSFCCHFSSQICDSDTKGLAISFVLHPLDFIIRKHHFNVLGTSKTCDRTDDLRRNPVAEPPWKLKILVPVFF